ncbi:unnamed protein product [Darwinula stevensoni]|uniref:Kringle domain-containing protein n=1 Tax=Darwinula stevensoni TaxID=69355 RepID=A0A7R9AB02_9CRUS|nr:unnamed protein product [Darwinula stevensoni]CAG0898761.1 unnamed protein product [Darwinula stevensoni]
MEPRRSLEDILRIFLVFLLSSRGVASVELIPYLGVHPGQRYENVSSESQELSLGMCTINCVMQKPIPCYAFNYRETDRSCQLILNRMSRLVDANGYWSYVQWLCLREYPTIENAKVSFEGWNGKYPAPARGIVKFRCEHPKGFSDGALLHTAECAPLNPDSWCISFRKEAVQCEKVHIYPECRLTESGKEYVGKVSVTESGRKCLKWRDYPYGTEDEYPGGPHLNFSSSDPSGTPIINLEFEGWFLNRDSWSHHNYCRNPFWGDRPWCFVSTPNITWEYCNIPMCTDTVPPECKVTQQGGEYMGRKDVTILGYPCLPWRMEEYRYFIIRAFPDFDRIDAHHNFCRNPWMQKFNTPYFTGVNMAPWCFIDVGNRIRPAYCDIPFCNKRVEDEGDRTGVYPECRLSEKGKEYVGSQNETETGKACLSWDLNPYGVPWDFFPRGEKHFTKYFHPRNRLPGDKVGHNHCRNPGVFRERPWCFVSDIDTKWEYCDIPLPRPKFDYSHPALQ